MSWNQTSFATPQISDERVGAFLRSVYAWMCVGLFVTAGVAFAIASSETFIETLLLNRVLIWGILLAQLGLVFYLSARVNKVAPATAAILFLVYSALVGVTSSVILLIYTAASVASTFELTSRHAPRRLSTSGVANSATKTRARIIFASRPDVILLFSTSGRFEKRQA